MKKSIALMPAIVATAVLSASAFAASMSKVGDVKSTDAAKNELVLSTGDTFTLPKSFKTDALKVGEKVKVTYEMHDGKMVATHVNPEK